MDVFHIYTQGTSVLKIQNVQKSNTLEHNQENVITTMTWVGGGGVLWILNIVAGPKPMKYIPLQVSLLYHKSQSTM